MNRRVLWVAAFALGLASAAQAGVHNMAGCGLGAMLFKNNVKGEQILAATTNGTGFQTFGISSETMGCTKDGVVKNDKRREVYASVNLQKLSQEMAQGRGEYLNGFASLTGCRDSKAQEAFAKFAQSNYQKLFTNEATDAGQLLQNVDRELAADPTLTQACAS